MRRASYQAGWVWGNAISQEPTPKLSEFGWTVVNGKPNILWSADGAKTGIIDEITKTCKCKVSSSSVNEPKDKCKNCMCAKAKFSCLEQCNCLRQCKKQEQNNRMNTSIILRVSLIYHLMFCPIVKYCVP